MTRSHVLCIVENNSVPKDIRVWREAHAIRQWDIKVSIISPRSERDSLPFEKREGIEIYRYPNIEFIHGKAAFIAEYLNALFWQSVLALKIFIHHPFQVIHAANPPDMIFLLAWFYRLFGTRFIFDHHDLSPEVYLSRFSGRKDLFYHMLYLCEKLSCRTADAIISTNRSFKDIVMKRHGIEGKRFHIVRNDPVHRETPQQEDYHSEALGDESIVIGYLGTINPQDGVDILIEAAALLVHDMNVHNLKYLIMGDGDALQSVRNKVREMKLDPYVDFTGFIHEKSIIHSNLARTDICVEPAPDNEMNRYSTFIKIMEYMEAGKPIVAFDLRETRYSSGGSALLVEPKDTRGFAGAIKQLVDAPELRRQLGETGKKRIRKALNWDKAAEELKEAYISLGMIRQHMEVR